MRFAYLIIAHNEFPLLEKLLRLLDDSRNDIYLHIDAKASGVPADLPGACRRSRVILLPRRKVYWGGYSQIDTELRLMQAAAGERYDYYHLLSGVDLPLRSQDAIHAFFEANAGCEFVGIAPGKAEDPGTVRKYRYYYFLKDHYNRTPLLLSAERFFCRLQAPFVDRRDSGLEYKAGLNWFSITHDFCEYVLARRDWIARRFRRTFCCDEVFLQTLLRNSPFRDRQYRADAGDEFRQAVRYIDWTRGNPYTFTMGDFEELMASDAMFARKFSDKTPEARQLTDALCAALRAK